MTERPTIIDFVEKNTRQFADHVYLREKVNGKWTEITQEQTRNEAYRIGAGLISLGVKKGDKIALLSESRAMWILAEIGALYAGAVDVPLSVNLGEGKDLVFRINHSESKYIFVSGNHLPRIRAILAECPDVEKVIVFDDTAFDYDKLEPKEIRMSEIQKMGDEFLKAHHGRVRGPLQVHRPGRLCEHLLHLRHDGGPEGHPPDAPQLHGQRRPGQLGHLHRPGLHDAHHPPAGPLLRARGGHVHDDGYYAGSIAFVPIGKNALATLRNVPAAIAETRPHVMLSVPALARNFKKNIEAGIKKKGPKVEKLFNFAVQNAIKYNKEYYNRGTGGTFWRKPLVALFDKILFKQVRESFGGRMQFFVGGGALLDIELQRFFCAVGMPMFQGYGLTEATPIICANSAGHARFGSSGRLVKPMDIVILDAEGKEVPHGTRGEIVIRGENVMAGYWKNPKATADTIIDGWLHTGDMGYICPEDPEFLYVVGRFKSLLISSDGEKYSPEGFEDNLTEVSKFVNACVLHNNQKPYCVALIVPDKAALKEAVEAKGLDAASEEGRKAMLDIIQQEVDSYKKGGKHEGMFPERWLPTAIGICDEEFTIANKMMNSTMKIVRGKVEEHYASLLDYLYTAEGKDIKNPRNLEALK